jgi:hypothetical protein
MKNIRVAILGMMVMIVVTGYAIDEPQGPINIFTIPTKNHNHRGILDILHEGSQNGVKRIMVGYVSTICTLIQWGYHDQAKQMRIEARERCFQFAERGRQEAQQTLLRWGYLV